MISGTPVLSDTVSAGVVEQKTPVHLFFSQLTCAIRYIQRASKATQYTVSYAVSTVKEHVGTRASGRLYLYFARCVPILLVPTTKLFRLAFLRWETSTVVDNERGLKTLVYLASHCVH